MSQPGFILKVKSPCNEEWSTMTKSEYGRFCSHCKREVIDFSGLTDEEIFKIINDTGTKLCGRLTEDQLDRTISKKSKCPTFSFSKILAGLFLLGLTKTSEVLGKQVKNKTVSIQLVKTVRSENIEDIARDTSLNKIIGNVIDKETKEGLNSALIIIKGTNVGVVTNTEGNFSLNIPDHLLNSPIHIIISSVGYCKQEYTINTNNLNTTKEYLITKSEEILMGEVVVVKKKKWWQF